MDKRGFMMDHIYMTVVDYFLCRYIFARQGFLIRPASHCILIVFILTIRLSVVKVYLYNIVNMMEYDESPSKYNIHIAGRNSFHAAIFQVKIRHKQIQKSSLQNDSN